MNPGGLLVAIVFLAAFNEWLVERLFGKWVHGDWMIGISTVFGIGLCLLFGLDGLSLLPLPAPVWGAPYSGEVLTGIVVGAGSNIAHDWFGKLRANDT